MADPAPLLTIPEAPAPAGGSAEWFAGAGGTRLRAALFKPRGRVRGSIVLSGGRTEPIEKYYEVIGEFLDRGFVVLAHDWRGQGLSARALGDRRKGHAIGGYKLFLGDFAALLTAFEKRLPRPWVAVGHSMGGCLTLLAMAKGETRFAGAVLSAPMLGLQTAPVSVSAARFLARTKVMLGHGARYAGGQAGKPQNEVFEGNILTHDRRRFERTAALLAAEDDLALGGPTWGWLDFAFRATAYLAQPDRLRAITAPVIILSAEKDKLVDNAAQRAAARHLPQGKFVNVPGAYHEILMETEDMRSFFMKAFDTLTGRAAPRPAEASKAAATPPSLAPAAAAPPVPKPAPAPVAAAPKPAASAKPKTPRQAAKRKAAKPAPDKKPAAAKKAPAKKAVKAAPKAKAAKAPAPRAAAAKAPKAKSAAKAAPKRAAAKAAKPGTARKPAAKAVPAKAVASKPGVAKKPAAKKPAARKPAAKKTVAKKAAV